MIIDDLDALAPSHNRAIIINYNTKLVSTLALLAALRYAGMPVLLIDCESSDGSFGHFVDLLNRYDYDLISMPLQEHGKTLDVIFSRIPADNVLAIDSDLEILDFRLIEFCQQYIDRSCVYGCGFVSGPQILTGEPFQGTMLDGALYDERFWMPIVMLKVAPVRKALMQGISFAASQVDNEYSANGTLSRFHRLPLLRKFMKTGPSWLRHPYHTTLRPSAIYHDTGSHIDHYLKYHERLYFAGLPGPLHNEYVTHFFGTTRNEIDPNNKHGGGGSRAIFDKVSERLSSQYGFEL